MGGEGRGAKIQKPIFSRRSIKLREGVHVLYRYDTTLDQQKRREEKSRAVQYSTVAYQQHSNMISMHHESYVITSDIIYIYIYIYMCMQSQSDMAVQQNSIRYGSTVQHSTPFHTVRYCTLAYSTVEQSSLSRVMHMQCDAVQSMHMSMSNIYSAMNSSEQYV